MTHERFAELVRFRHPDNKILQDFCDRAHDFEAELAAVTSPKVLAALEAENISAVNFAALR